MSNDSLGPPKPLSKDPQLPFFAYGLFQADQIRFRQISDLVSSATSATTKGALMVRDGLPFLDDSIRDSSVNRSLIESGRLKDLYARVGKAESEDLYRWKTIDCRVKGTTVEAYALVGKSPAKSHPQPFETSRWTIQEDPVLTSGFKTAQTIIKDEATEKFDLAAGIDPESSEGDRYFRLHAGYLLLWTVIERMTTLAYGPAVGPVARNKCLAHEPSFRIAFEPALKERPPTYRYVYASHDLEKTTLKSRGPSKAVKHFYAVRSNLTHRGKAAVDDLEILREAALLLVPIVNAVLMDFMDPNASGLERNPLPQRRHRN